MHDVSPAAYPSCRSYALPLGYDRSDGKTFHGNLLAFHSFTMLRAGRRARRLVDWSSHAAPRCVGHLCGDLWPVFVDLFSSSLLALSSLVCCLVFVLSHYCMFLVLAALGVELGKHPPKVFPRGVAFSLILLSGSAMAMEPLTAAERARALHRAETVLIPTRTVRKVTREGREKLLKLFGRWLFDNHQVSLEFLLAAKPADPEEICKWLVLYGQDMFLSGKAYGSFSETITLSELPGQ